MNSNVLDYQVFLLAYRRYPEKADIATKRIAKALRAQWKYVSAVNSFGEGSKMVSRVCEERDQDVKKAAELLLQLNSLAKSDGNEFIRCHIKKEDLQDCLRLILPFLTETITTINGVCRTVEGGQR